jgi:hypothetical protein
LFRTFRWIVCLVLLAFAGCDNTAAPASKINRANYDQIHTGMSKAEGRAFREIRSPPATGYPLLVTDPEPWAASPGRELSRSEGASA